MKLKAIIAGLLLTAAAGASAHDFTVTIDGQRLYFDITNKANRTAAVTYNGSIADMKANDIAGNVEIPSKVKHDNVIYDVTAINPKAFAGAKHLKGIVIPSGVTSIGDFAFEGCDSLAGIVFPGNEVTLGQGTFFLCPAISDVTIGSDWTAIDLTMFRWSDRLTRINIPAKIGKIQGLKKLKKLKEITVDTNNGKFEAVDGMLYSKDGKTLYGCPRAYAGKVTVKEGTETITPGALADCVDVTCIDFPASLQNVSFRETAALGNLAVIIMRPVKPIINAYTNGEGKFLMQTANGNVIVEVPAPAKKEYEAAMATAPGEYAETATDVPYMVTAGQMPSKKNLKGFKK